MFASGAWHGCLLCAAVLALATALPRCAGAAAFQRESRFILPSGPDTSAWLPPPEIRAQPFAAAPVSGFVQARCSSLWGWSRSSCFAVSNTSPSLQANGTNLMVDGRIAFFAGSNNFFLALRHSHVPLHRFPARRCCTRAILLLKQVSHFCRAYITDAQVRQFFQVSSPATQPRSSCAFTRCSATGSCRL